MTDLVQLTKDNDIAIITINNPPVNALSPGVPEGISEALDQIALAASIKAVVLIGGGRTFVAGADMTHRRLAHRHAHLNLAFIPAFRARGPERSAKETHPGLGWFCTVRRRRYFGITSCANLLITTSRISLRFFPASIMASREP